MTAPQRQRLQAGGRVQGVGFRPFVYTLAQRCGLAGFVRNDSQGVCIEVEGSPAALAEFERGLRAELPPLARLESLTISAIPPVGQTTFSILGSTREEGSSVLLPPDVAPCADCKRDLADPAGRFYRYPFVTCTACGPRFTVIQSLPYDRAGTTLAAFALCPACAAEYADPAGRRFHAETIACPVCGPRLWYQDRAGMIPGEAGLRAAQQALAWGLVLAVRGVGGFHLACDATSAAAVERLRQRKQRPHKPLAVMVRDVGMARRLAHVTDDEAGYLTGQVRPIVLLPKHPASPVCAAVAPDTPEIGLMLPSSPLHDLLLTAAATPLVMTSGNLSGEPIIIDNDEALARLAPLADAFLLHDRPIHQHCDDSVLRVAAGPPVLLRRARGLVPLPLPLPAAGPPLLAVGAELKNTFCLTRGRQAFVSQHIGDMGSLAALATFERARQHWQALYDLLPQAFICDLHPDYHTTHLAQRLHRAQGLPLLRVQHHHAHLAALMAEHGLAGDTPVIGVCLDGTGYGTDGAIWGGEVLLADYAGCRRLAHLAYVPLPGGDAAIRHPWRSALAHLWAAGVPWADDLPPVAVASPLEKNVIARQMATGTGTVLTSSVGRLFDAVAALLDVCQHSTYEARAAAGLEALAQPAAEPYPFDLLAQPDGTSVLSPVPLLRALVADRRAGVPRPISAGRFHTTLAHMFAAACRQARAQSGVATVGLTGGVFQNVRLLTQLQAQLAADGFTVLTHEQVPAHDGGLSYGQAVVGAWRLTYPPKEDV